DRFTLQSRLRALVFAAAHQRLDVIDALIEAGTPVNEPDAEWGRLPLHTAAGNRPAATLPPPPPHGAHPHPPAPRHHPRPPDTATSKPPSAPSPRTTRSPPAPEPRERLVLGARRFAYRDTMNICLQLIGGSG